MSIDDNDLLLLNAYCDGELSPGETLAMEQKLRQDPELAAMARQLQDLSGKLSGALGGVSPPTGLNDRILAALPDEDDDRASAAANDDTRPSSHVRPSWRALAACLALGLVTGALGGGYAIYLKLGKDNLSALERTIVAAHLRGLMAPQPFDIASSDNHVVKPWFNGRTTIAPTAPDFADAGFPLAGGRVDIVDGKPVPTLVYHRARHTISVTITATSVDDGALPADVDGTHVMHWQSGDLTYWVVSDVNTKDLAQFVALYRQQMPPG